MTLFEPYVPPGRKVTRYYESEGVLARQVGLGQTEVFWLPPDPCWHHFSINTALCRNLSRDQARERFPDAFPQLVRD